MKYLKVEDKDGLVRDCETNAILNTDMNAYNEYVRNYQSKLKENKRIQDLENKIGDIKSDIDEIKNLLKEFLKWTLIILN